MSGGKLLILIIGGALLFLLILIVVVYILFSRGEAPAPPPRESSPITLEFWGIFDDSDVFEPIIEAYTKEHPKVSIRYRKLLWDDYEPTLVNAIASQRGPDIFMVHNTWLAKHQEKLASAPITSTKYKENFVASTQNDFIRQGKVYALPLFIDNFALFYNRDIFAKEGFNTPPLTWEQFSDYVKALTRFSSEGGLIYSGAAIGTSSKTINRATDLLLLLLLQNGVLPLDPQKKEVSWRDDDEAFSAAKDALRFYTDFANPSKEVYTWNEKQLYSIDAFYQGKVAMIFNYAYNIPIIKAKAPYLNFGVAPLPKKGRPVTLTNYWGVGVSSQSPYQSQAWDFLQFLTAKDKYTEYIKTTGRLSSRLDFLETQNDDPLLRPFIQQSRDMVTPYQPDGKKMQTIFDEVINSVVSGSASLDQALRKAADRLQLLIQ